MISYRQEPESNKGGCSCALNPDFSKRFLFGTKPLFSFKDRKVYCDFYDYDIFATCDSDDDVPNVKTPDKFLAWDTKNKTIVRSTIKPPFIYSFLEKAFDWCREIKQMIKEI